MRLHLIAASVLLCISSTAHAQSVYTEQMSINSVAKADVPLPPDADMEAVTQYLRMHFAKCWDVPPNTQVSALPTLEVLLDIDGKVTEVHLQKAQTLTYNNDPQFKAMADSAIAAVKKCVVVKGLPKAFFNKWKELELKFDASTFE